MSLFVPDFSDEQFVLGMSRKEREMSEVIFENVPASPKLVGLKGQGDIGSFLRNWRYSICYISLIHCGTPVNQHEFCAKAGMDTGTLTKYYRPIAKRCEELALFKMKGN